MDRIPLPAPYPVGTTMSEATPGTGEQGYDAGLNSHLRYTANPFERGTDAGEVWFAAYMDGVGERRRIDLEWTRRLGERVERVRGASQEDKSAAWERMRAVEREARSTVPKASPAESVVVARPHSSSRHYSYKAIHGPRPEALAFCSHVFATDRCTPMYEHMLWKMFAAEEHEDGTVTLWLSKSNYAGD